MDVFMQNVPNVGNKGMAELLKPFTDRLGISEHTYDCVQPRRKPFAIVTFLYTRDGQKFLGKHGQKKRPGGSGFIPCLSLAGLQVSCRQSNRGPPDPITLRGLREQVEKAKQAAQKAVQQAAEEQADKMAGRHVSLKSPPPKGRLPLDPVPRAGSTLRGSSSGYRDDSSHSRGSSRHGHDSMPILALRSFSCGFYTYDTNNRLFYVPETTEVRSGNVKFGKRNLALELDDGTMVQMPLASIQEAVWSPSGDITLTLNTVPLFFSHLMDAQYVGGPLRRSRLVSRSTAHAAVVGACRIYRLAVMPTEHLERCMHKLSQLRVITVTKSGVPMRLTNGSGSHNSSFADSLRYLDNFLGIFTKTAQLPFGILFQLQSLAYNAYLHPETVVGMALLLAKSWKTKPVSVQAMRNLFPAIDWPTPEYPDPSDFTPEALVDYLYANEDALQRNPDTNLVPNGDNMVFVHRVMVSPTCITLHGPEIENRNRVLRMYPDRVEYFMRVQFCDENGQNLHFTNRVDYDTIYSRFKTIMLDGFSIAGRRYTLLGWSNSSLRAHTVWFSAPFTSGGALVTPLAIKLKLGDFAAIRTPARCAARIGQAFSETPWTVPLRDHGIRTCEIEDVMSADGKRVFSDGVGSISLDALKVVWSLVAQRTNPTCLQIRYAGSKGMLALDTRLFSKEIRIRPSMTKFESKETANLEICDMSSRPISLYLNRQLVKILEDMHVPEYWFWKLQRNALEELRIITSSAYNMANYVKKQCVAMSIRLHRLIRLSDELSMDYRTEPFLRHATEAIILRELRLLKHKARMFVPKGITLFGVMDETGFLQEGEVYIAINNRPRSKSQRYQDPPESGDRVLVTRSPALHPGDIQFAIHTEPGNPDHPLRQLQNCIVFSSQGARDLPSQLSGGDLDGDIFNIIWDLAVCRYPAVQTYTAADYPRQTPVDIGREVTIDDMAGFFVDFMKTDYLGAIATRHMILCDQRKGGSLDADSILLAEMHSTAVDFSKTGIPADLKKLPKVNKFRPDFLSPGPIAKIYDREEIELEEYMEDDEEERDGDDTLEMPAYKYYKSNKILGELYRAVDETKIWYDDVRQSSRAPAADKRPPDFYNTFLAWVREECAGLGCDDWKHRSAQAVRILESYEDMMINTMHDFSEHPTQPLTELEVFIGSIINRTGGQTPRQRDRSRKLRDEFERISMVAMEMMRPKAAREDGLSVEDRFSALELCLACVHPPPSKLRPRRRRHDIQIESFWLVAASALLRELEWIRNGLLAEQVANAQMQGQEQGQEQKAEEEDEWSSDDDDGDYTIEGGGVSLKPFKYGSAKTAHENHEARKSEARQVGDLGKLVAGMALERNK